MYREVKFLGLHRDQAHDAVMVHPGVFNAPLRIIIFEDAQADAVIVFRWQIRRKRAGLACAFEFGEKITGVSCPGKFDVIAVSCGDEGARQRVYGRKVEPNVRPFPIDKAKLFKGLASRQRDGLVGMPLFCNHARVRGDERAAHNHEE